MIIFLATVIALGLAESDGLANNSPCKTAECSKGASMLLNNMDTRIDPCDNFYEFACGQFIKDTVLPDEFSVVDTFSLVQEDVDKLRNLIITDEIKENDLNAIKLMKSFYNICMNAGKIEKNGRKYLLEVLKKLGGWPVLEGPSWNETNFDWKRLAYEATKIGYHDVIFLSLNVATDDYNNSRSIISIQRAHTSLLRNHVNNNKYIDEYADVVLKRAVSLGANREQAKKELRDAVNFGVKLSQLSPIDKNGHDLVSNKRLTLQQLEAEFTGIPWGEYINEVMSPHAHLEANEQIIVEVPEFVDGLIKLLANTPKRTIANYALWRVVSRSSIHHKDNAYAEPRMSKCLDHTYDYFKVAINSLFVRRFFDKSTENNALTMVQNIKSSLHQIINEADWMDDVTKQAALEKLNFMKQNVGYPKELISDPKLNEYYENLNLDSEVFFKADLCMRRFRRGKKFSILHKPVNEILWETDSLKASEGDAEYVHAANLINIPAGILQGYFYNANRPNYMNFGIIGWVIGHEFTHAFYTTGSLHDKDGMILDWWENETKKRFSERTKCINEQYGNYTVPELDMKIDGVHSQAENIADNGGLRAAYYAYNRWSKDKIQEPQLPGLNYTPRQMFWISAANLWCEKRTKSNIKYFLKNKPHAPGRFRVIGSMSNMPEFSNDFECPSGSPMNPTKKCSVW